MYYWNVTISIQTMKELCRYEIYHELDKALNNLNLDNIDAEMKIEFWESLESE